MAARTHVGLERLTATETGKIFARLRRARGRSGDALEKAMDVCFLCGTSVCYAISDNESMIDFKLSVTTQERGAGSNRLPFLKAYP